MAFDWTQLPLANTPWRIQVVADNHAGMTPLHLGPKTVQAGFASVRVYSCSTKRQDRGLINPKGKTWH
ncbi:TPA: hypothetical protein QEM98_000259 [Stenotrophomonas maltophilia]|nr:hypothetical protein [Stenotrophomonas maltophilia]